MKKLVHGLNSNSMCNLTYQFAVQNDKLGDEIKMDQQYGYASLVLRIPAEKSVIDPAGA